MSEKGAMNFLRLRAIVQSRQVKAVFFAQEGKLSRAGEAVLSDLRDYCRAQETLFDTDPLIMARMAGRREVWLRLVKFLNLDEAQVQSLMEVDDGY